MTSVEPSGTPGSTGQVQSINPEPTDEEVAAILAAVEVGIPRAGAGESRPEVSRWRFSGRWWSRPVPVRRIRPNG